jgi:hypothetical protein
MIAKIENILRKKPNKPKLYIFLKNIVFNFIKKQKIFLFLRILYFTFTNNPKYKKIRFYKFY